MEVKHTGYFEGALHHERNTGKFTSGGCFVNSYFKKDDGGYWNVTGTHHSDFWNYDIWWGHLEFQTGDGDYNRPHSLQVQFYIKF